MHNRYADPNYAEIIAKMKGDLLKTRKDLGDTDEGNARILKVIEEHWDD